MNNELISTIYDEYPKFSQADIDRAVFKIAGKMLINQHGNSMLKNL